MPGHDIITIGASAGGVEALSEVVRHLPEDLPASVLVALHVPSHGLSALPQILGRSGPLPARHAEDGEAIEPGRICVAPPDHHLLVQRGRARLSRGPRENGVRPAIDPLFRSAARWYGPRTIGVVLSGTLDDGSAGLLAIRERGGEAIVQDPDDALFSGMPRSALEGVPTARVAPAAAIAGLLDQLSRRDAGGQGDPPMPEHMDLESAIAGFDLGVIQRDERPGKPSGFACPDCAGVLWELQESEMVRYRCRVGHAWSPTSLLAEQSHSLEVALWTAFRALEERAALAARLAERLREKGRAQAAGRFVAQAREAKQRSALIRQVLLKDDPEAEHEPGPGMPGGGGGGGGGSSPRREQGPDLGAGPAGGPG